MTQCIDDTNPECQDYDRSSFDRQKRIEKPFHENKYLSELFSNPSQFVVGWALIIRRLFDDGMD